MKVCCKCKLEKQYSEFNKASKAKDGLQAMCRQCFKAVYQDDKQTQIDRVAKRNKQHRANLKAYVWTLKKAPCSDCNKSYHPFVMDFDHVRGVKHRDINQLVQSACSWKMLNAELAKCELVCSNCHRIRTWTRLENGKPSVCFVADKI